MHYLRWLYWTTAIAAAFGGVQPVRGSTASDQAADIVIFPQISTDTQAGVDTVVELANTSATLLSVRCFYKRADRACSNAASFFVRLTPWQPITWRVSQGRSTFPLDGVARFGPQGTSNAGSSVPPASGDPFTGSLECIAVDDNGTPTARNALVGQATLEQYRTSPAPFFDATQYSGIGIPSVPGFITPGDTLTLGGSGGDYSGCPQTLILSHFFDEAVDPATKTSSVMTSLILMPCSQNLAGNTDRQVAVQYQLFNEWEQQFTTTQILNGCEQAGPLSSIDARQPSVSIFDVAVTGTLTGQTRVFTAAADSGILAVAVEAHHDLSDPARVRYAAFNVHATGERSGPDTIALAASAFSPTPVPPAATPTPTQTLPGTPVPTRTPSPTGTATAPTDPQITFFGVTRADDTPADSIGNTADDIPIYQRLAGSGFSLVVEGRPGRAGARLGTSSFSSNDVNLLPDLQVEVSRPLGNGSAAVCDDGDPTFGGVPAVSPFDFSLAEAPAINDLACRFKDGQNHPVGRPASEACTRFLPELEYHFVDPASTIQFCGVVDKPLSFPSGDTMVAARIRDTAGNVSAVAQLVIRVATSVSSPTATPTATPSPAATPTATPSPAPTSTATAPRRTNFTDSDGCALASPRSGIWNGAIFGLLPLVLVCWRQRRERKRPPSW